MIPADTLKELLGTPPAEFVAARNAMVKALKAAGQRDTADEVAALRRIGPAEWALNRAATSDPDAAARFAAAATEVISVQQAAMAGRSSSDLRAALKEMRDRAAALVTAAHAVAREHGQSAATTAPPALSARLSEIATRPVALDLLRHGLLGAQDPGGSDPFGMIDSGESPTGDLIERRADRGRRGGDGAESPPSRHHRADRAREEQRRRTERQRTERQRTERQRKDAEAALARAERELVAQERRVATAARRVAELEEQLGAAREALVAAEGEREQTRHQRDQLASVIAAPADAGGTRRPSPSGR